MKSLNTITVFLLIFLFTSSFFLLTNNYNNGKKLSFIFVAYSPYIRITSVSIKKINFYEINFYGSYSYLFGNYTRHIFLPNNNFLYDFFSIFMVLYGVFGIINYFIKKNKSSLKAGIILLIVFPIISYFLLFGTSAFFKLYFLIIKLFVFIIKNLTPISFNNYFIFAEWSFIFICCFFLGLFLFSLVINNEKEFK